MASFHSATLDPDPNRVLRIRPSIRAAAQLLLLLQIIAFSSCSTDKLTKEYDAFEGLYEWVSTGANKNAWTHESIDPQRTAYSVQLELDNEGHIVFYKDGSQLSQHSYKIVDRESNAYGKMIMLEIKGQTPDLDISDDRLTLRLVGDTGLTVDRFPFPAIDKADRYFQGYTSTSNSFHR